MEKIFCRFKNSYGISDIINFIDFLSVVMICDLLNNSIVFMGWYTSLCRTTFKIHGPVRLEYEVYHVAFTKLLLIL